MADNIIFFEHPQTGQLAAAPVGFSWTTAFFGPFPMLFRNDWKWFFVSLALAFFTGGLSSFVMMCIINKLHIQELVRQGFRVRSVQVGTVKQAEAVVGYPLPAFERAA